MQTESTVEEIPEALTAGEILQQERTRLGLNEKEVADQLHITMHYVRAIESNSYEKLPGAVFAKGYLKSYALLLGLDVEDLLSRYDSFADQQKADNDEVTRLANARRKKDRNKPLVIISLVVFVVGFLGLWLVNTYFSDDSVSDVPTTAENVEGAQNSQPALTQAVEAQVIPQPQLTLEVDQAPSDEDVEVPNQLADVNSNSVLDMQIADPNSESEGNSSAAEEGPTLEELTASLEALREEQAAAVIPAVESDEPQVITVEAIGNDVLRISFVGESWVEVNDSESQQIYRDIREAGDVLEITGSAPFSILLGDAPYTRMSLNGDEIDLSADIRIDNSARLTVGL